MTSQHSSRCSTINSMLSSANLRLVHQQLAAYYIVSAQTAVVRLALLQHQAAFWAEGQPNVASMPTCGFMVAQSRRTCSTSVTAHALARPICSTAAPDGPAAAAPAAAVPTVWGLGGPHLPPLAPASSWLSLSAGKLLMPRTVTHKAGPAGTDMQHHAAQGPAV